MQHFVNITMNYISDPSGKRRFFKFLFPLPRSTFTPDLNLNSSTASCKNLVSLNLINLVSRSEKHKNSEKLKKQSLGKSLDHKRALAAAFKTFRRTRFYPCSPASACCRKERKNGLLRFLHEAVVILRPY